MLAFYFKYKTQDKKTPSGMGLVTGYTAKAIYERIDEFINPSAVVLKSVGKDAGICFLGHDEDGKLALSAPELSERVYKDFVEVSGWRPFASIFPDFHPRKC
jgi:hypothetical protein